MSRNFLAGGMLAAMEPHELTAYCQPEYDAISGKNRLRYDEPAALPKPAQSDRRKNRNHRRRFACGDSCDRS